MNRQERNRQILNTDHLNRDLGRRTARGGMIAIAAQPIRMVMQFVFTAILVRLLAPEAFGLVAMATAVTSLVALFSELGLTSATIQRSQIDQNMVSGLFFVGLGISVVLIPLVCALAPLAALFFKDSRVANLVIVLSVSFPPFGAWRTAYGIAAALDARDGVAMDWSGWACGRRTGGGSDRLEDGPQLLVTRDYRTRRANRHTFSDLGCLPLAAEPRHELARCAK